MKTMLVKDNTFVVGIYRMDGNVLLVSEPEGESEIPASVELSVHDEGAEIITPSSTSVILYVPENHHHRFLGNIDFVHSDVEFRSKFNSRLSVYFSEMYSEHMSSFYEQLHGMMLNSEMSLSLYREGLN